VREQSWERTAQRVVGSLTQNRALCCANALTGDSGRWPDVDECALYVVSRLRRGPSGGGVDARALNNAVLDLLDDDRLDAQVVRQVSALILDPRRRTDHDRLDPQVRGYEAQSGAEASLPCRAAACNAPAIAGNYGFCRRHRAYLRENETPCKECGRPALTGNYGFCGRHRQTSREDIAQCRVCGRAAIEGNYGFCGYHRRG